jgi:hypothetical protein
MIENKKPVIIISIAVAIFVVLPIIIFLFFKVFTSDTHIKFLCAPSQVYISIDNKDKTLIKSGTTFSTTAGKHTITVTKSDYASYTGTINVDKGQTKSYAVVLTGLTDAAKQAEAADLTDEIAQTWSGHDFNSYNNNLSKKYPIMKVLPYVKQSDDSSLIYKIYAESSSDNFYISIYLNTCSSYSYNLYKDDAISWIKSKGFDPSSYIIKYSSLCG